MTDSAATVKRKAKISERSLRKQRLDVRVHTLAFKEGRDALDGLYRDARELLRRLKQVEIDRDVERQSFRAAMRKPRTIRRGK